jgi:BirA family transcriptional regulator, biotin operon repressor / biotin---[acetyl-CoA-carboxylase] ligase
VSSNHAAPATLNMELLDRLRSARGQFVSLVDLGEDRARVWDDLEALRWFGFQIERHPYLGAAYRGPTGRLCPDQIEHGLKTRGIGRRITVWNRVGSTNDLAARAGSTPANDGLVVLAEEQTAGRGQRGRSWMAPARSSILMSVLLFPPSRLPLPGLEEPAGSAWLTALAAVATAELVSESTGCDARIKWPNDVRVEGRKIAGILVERALAPRATRSTAGEGVSRLRGVVIGIGLNVNLDIDTVPAELGTRITSLAALAGGAVLDRSELVRSLIERLDQWYWDVLASGPSVLSVPWRARSEHLGSMVKVVTPSEQVRGRLLDLDLLRGLTLELSAAGQVSADRLSDAGLESFPEVRQVALRNVLGLEE